MMMMGMEPLLCPLCILFLSGRAGAGHDDGEGAAALSSLLSGCRVSSLFLWVFVRLAAGWLAGVAGWLAGWLALSLSMCLRGAYAPGWVALTVCLAVRLPRGALSLQVSPRLPGGKIAGKGGKLWNRLQAKHEAREHDSSR